MTTKTLRESAGAFGNDYVQGGTGKDDVYGLLGNDWLEGNEDEDAIVGDMGKIVNNQLGGPTPDTIAGSAPLDQFITPNQPFLGSTINYSGSLKREVTLYAFDESQPATAGIGHDVALGGDANDAIHTGPGEDLANGNAGDDRIWLGDNFTATTAGKNKNAPSLLAHDRVDAAWGGSGHDHLWGGYGADYLDVRPRTHDEHARPRRRRATRRRGSRSPARRRRTTASSTTRRTSRESTSSTAAGIRTRCRRTTATTARSPATGCSTAAGVLQRQLRLPGHERRLDHDPRRPRRASSPTAERCRRAAARTRRQRPARPASARPRSCSQSEHGKNANPIHPDTPGHFTCGPGTTIP